MTKATTTQRVNVRGDVFGARGCSSCSCDPCDCNPCTCGNSLQPAYPEWRVSGYMIDKGEIHGIDVGGQLIISLAQPLQEAASNQWQEILLVSEQATPSQIEALLAAFATELESIPAEVKGYIRKPQAVYTLPIHYTGATEKPILQVTFTRQQAALIREGAYDTFKEWYYHGPMTLRNSFNSYQ